MILRTAGEAWADVGGGTSGAIWGRILASLATGFDGPDAPTPSDISRALEATVAEVRAFGGVDVGDKTLLDALAPEFTRAVGDATDPDEGALTVCASAAERAAEAATRGAEGTADLAARRGRARAHGEKSVGTPDPGAISLARIASAVADELTARTGLEPAPTPPSHRERKAARS